MSKRPKLEFSHVGFYVKDMALLSDFYTRVLGFMITDQGTTSFGEIRFLSQDTKDHHQFVLVDGRPDDVAFNTINQMSLRTGSLEDLRTVYQALKQEDSVTIQSMVTHGNAWSVYFKDPEGNVVEVFVDTPWYVKQPYAKPIDLDNTPEQIYAYTEKLVRDDPTFEPVEEWREHVARQMAESRG